MERFEDKFPGKKILELDAPTSKRLVEAKSRAGADALFGWKYGDNYAHVVRGNRIYVTGVEKGNPVGNVSVHDFDPNHPDHVAWRETNTKATKVKKGRHSTVDYNPPASAADLALRLS